MLALAALATPASLSAKQTLEEATDSIKTIYKNAQGGDASAQNIVGMWYYNGRHVDQDYKLAAKWWSRAAKAEDAQAIGNLGLCYQTGHGVDRDSLRATGLYNRSIREGNTELLKRMAASADKGNVFSQVYMALCYQKGIGVKKDIYKASSYFEMAAKKGSVDACRELGLLLLNNKQNTDAFGYFKTAAQKGDIPSTFYYGRMLAEGKGTKQDATLGMIQMQKAAEAGFAAAQLYLGRAYYEGNGVRKDPSQGYQWMLKAARQNNSNAQFQIAEKLVAGDGCQLDYNLATAWFGKAVANNHGKAFKKLFETGGALAGSPYLTYLQARKAIATDNFETALKKSKDLQKSKTEAIAQTGKTLEGIILCNKDYAKRDLKKGVKMLEKCVATGNATAEYVLGAMYDAGKQVERDQNKAVDLISSSAKAGNPLAISYLGDMYFEGRGVQQDYEKAIQCYNDASVLMTETAAKHLAACYENGYGGLEADQKKASQILKGKYGSNLEALVDLLP